MDKAEITRFLAALDSHLSAPSTLYIYGSAVVILLDAPDRTSLDIDVAGPYSRIDQAALQRAAEQVRMPVNPEPAYDGPHIEWVGPLRLCLPPPRQPEGGLLLWQGTKLHVRTGNVEELVASKLIRYDATDRADVQFLHAQFRFSAESVQDAVGRLPHPFRDDALVRENLANLLLDMQVWRGEA
jgi:hypothetical protein